MPDQDALTMADVLNKALPALSATSDMPDPAAAQEATVAPTDTSQETPAAAAEISVSDDDPTETAEVKTEARGVGKKLHRLESERHAAVRRADEAQQQLRTALKTIEQLTGKDGAPGAPGDGDPRPRRELFDDPDRYDSALVEWSAKQAARQTRTEEQKARVDKENEDRVNQIRMSYTDKRDKFIDDHPDFEEVAERDDLKITPNMAWAIAQSEHGPALAYHLGKNPNEAIRIAGLNNPVQEAYEIGKIAASLNTKPSRSVSGTPAPIKPLGGSTKAESKRAEDMSMEEYAAKRTSDIRSAYRDRMGLNTKINS